MLNLQNPLEPFVGGLANNILIAVGRVFECYYKQVDPECLVSVKTSPNMCTIILNNCDGLDELFESFLIPQYGGEEAEHIVNLLLHHHLSDFDAVFENAEAKQIYYHPRVILYAIERAFMEAIANCIWNNVDMGFLSYNKGNLILRDIHDTLNQSFVFKISFDESKDDEVVFEVYK